MVIGSHFGGGDHFDGGDHFSGGTSHQASQQTNFGRVRDQPAPEAKFI